MDEQESLQNENGTKWCCSACTACRGNATTPKVGGSYTEGGPLLWEGLHTNDVYCRNKSQLMTHQTSFQVMKTYDATISRT